MNSQPGTSTNPYLNAQASEGEIGILEPMSRMKALTEYGNTVDIDITIPPRRYYRSGLEMVRMANVYLEEGSLENAFILYMKFMTLFLEKIRQHPDFKNVSVTDRTINSQKLREIIPIAEKLKSQLIEEYSKDYQYYLQTKRKQDALEKERLRALEEQRRKEEEAKRKYEEGLPKLPEDNPKLLGHKLIQKMKEEKASAEAAALEEKRRRLRYGNSKPPPDTNAKKLQVSKILSKKETLAAKSVPIVDRTTKPSSILSPSLALKFILRDVIVPAKLMAKFMNLAQRNTELNIETCGILAGLLNHDKLIITHLLVPKQSGTPDSCATHGEEEIFDFQDAHDLITLGWIHTHPSQTAFLSSVDLHTHCSYQRMMPEAIAIVCAPRYQENGFFSLTPDYGLDFIASCKLSGFHPHPTEPPLYKKADHVKLDSTVDVDVVDLRR